MEKHLLIRKEYEDVIKIRSDYRQELYDNIYKICYDILVKMDKDMIKMIMSYYEDLPINGYFYDRKLLHTNEFNYGYVIRGNYVTIMILNFIDYGGDDRNAARININKNIGNHTNKLIEKWDVYKEYEDGMNYGELYNVYSWYAPRLSQNLRINEINDFREYIPNVYDIVNVDGWSFTQIRKGRDIIKGTTFHNEINKNPNKYYFISTTFRKFGEYTTGYLVELSYYEYKMIIDELKEMNRIIKN